MTDAERPKRTIDVDDILRLVVFDPAEDGAFGRHGFTVETREDTDDEFWPDICVRFRSDATRQEFAAALLPPGTVAVDAGRLERLLTVAEAARDWLNAPYDPARDGENEEWAAAETALLHAVKALQPGDLAGAGTEAPA